MTVAACGAETPETEQVGSDSEAVRGAVYTTFDEEQGGCLHGNGNGINCNHYEYKCDVYVSGGPTKAGLSDGDYYFTILAPGAQNGGFNDGAGGNLSDDYDSEANRSFRVENHAIVANYGDHEEGETPNGKVAIQACDYADTPNNGGVYILAVCLVGATSPSQCKYDAFKVRDQEEPECGDGNVDPGEACDDGNEVDDDACSNECEVPVYPCCGDGHVDPGEDCESDSDCDTGYTCDDACVCVPPPPVCGNCVVEEGEQCDDGNTDDLYCDSYCQLCTPTNGTYD